MASLLTYDSNNVVSTITLNDGKANVLSVHMLRELDAALDQAQAENNVVFIAGRERMFSAGFDLQVFKQSREAQTEMLLAGAKLAERLLSFPAPVVIACTGHAIAMGAFLLLSGDVRFGAAGSAAKISVNEVAIGLTLPRFATEICRQRLTPAQFNRAAITAEAYSPERALEAGFLDELVATDQLIEAASAKAHALANLDRAAHKATKLRVREGALAALKRAIELDQQDWNSR